MLAFKPVRGGIAGDANVRAILVQLFCHCRRIHIAQIDPNIRVIAHKPLLHRRQEHLCHRGGHRQHGRPKFGLRQPFYRRNSTVKIAQLTLGLS